MFARLLEWLSPSYKAHRAIGARLRWLEQRRTTLKQQHRQQILQASGHDVQRLAEQFFLEQQPFSQEHDELRSQLLLPKADRLGIEVPQDWFYPVGNGGRALAPREQRRLKRLIDSTRFDYWKRWVELLVPVLSLLVALAALILAR